MFRTLPIKTRLMFSGVVSISSVLILAGLSIYSLRQSEIELERQISVGNAVRQELTVDMMHDSIEASVVYSILHGIEASAQEQSHIKDHLAADIAAFHGAMELLSGMELTGEIHANIAGIREPAAEFIDQGEAIVALAFSDREAAMALLPALQGRYETLSDVLKPLGESIEIFAIETADAARIHDRNLLYVLVAFSVVVIAAIAANARAVSLTIIRPIGRLRLALRDVSEGDFGLKIANRMRRDEFGEIATDIDRISERVAVALAEQKALQDESDQVISRLQAGLQRMADGDLSRPISVSFGENYEMLRLHYNEAVNKLSELMSQVVQASSRIQNQSNGIREASDDLSQRTESQAATLEETAAALEQMTDSVQSSANNAQDVATAVEVARGEVQQSGEIVEGAISAMHEIEASSSQISQIIGVIDDIAFQTNLLALNAGVEAARAGEVGRGFAVVASEVRALAQRSSEAASEIKTLIETSTQHVQDGVGKVDGAGKALSAVVSRVTEISDLVTRISNEAAGQAQGLGEVNIGVAQLDQVTQKNVAMVESSSTAIRSMNEETLGLNKLVAQFSISASTATRSGGSIGQDGVQQIGRRSA